MSARIHSEGHIEQDYAKNHPFGMEGGFAALLRFWRILTCLRVVGVVERYAFGSLGGLSVLHLRAKAKAEVRPVLSGDDAR